MSLVVKFGCKGEFRRARVDSLSWENVIAACAATYPELHRDAFDLKYLDDEGDVCLLSVATFPDFADLNQAVKSVKVEVVMKPAPRLPTSAAPKQPAGPEMPCWDAFGANFPFHMLQGLLAGGKQECWGDFLAGLFVAHLPQILEHVRKGSKDIEKIAACKPEILRSVAQALLEALEPFPQMQEVREHVQRLLNAEKLEGVAAATEMFLQSLLKLPAMEQQQVSSVVISRLLEELLHIIPQEMAKAWKPPHVGSTEGEDGQESSPCSERWGKGKGKGKGKCKMMKGLLHCLTGSARHDHGDWCGKGWGKGWGDECGKGWGKGWGKGCAFADEEERKAWLEQKEERKNRKQEWWAAMKVKMEAAHAAAQQETTAKEAAPQSTEPAEEQKPDQATVPSPQEPAASAPLEVKPQSLVFSVPVVVDGDHQLNLTWTSGEAPDQVAVRFAQEHNIPESDLPSIVAFIRANDPQAAAKREDQ